MNRIDAAFASLRQRGEKGLILYLTVGDPDLETTRLCALAVAAEGADVIELGFPFSDPIADGPIIQAASARALAGGMKWEKVWELGRSLRQVTGVPLVLLSYYNPVLQYGEERLARAAREAGLDGVMVPDLPWEEGESLRSACEAEGLYLIPFLAPTSPPERVARVAREGKGFIYCVSLTGVTGPRAHLPAQLRDMVARIRPFTSLPLAVGFGIAGPEQAREAAEVADAVIVGSALVRVIAEAGLSPGERARAAGTFSRSLRRALDEVKTGSGRR